MDKGEFIKKTITVCGAATLLGVGAPACSGTSDQPTTGPDQQTENEPAMTETDNEPATTEPAATDQEPAATDQEPAATDQEPAATDQEPASAEPDQAQNTEPEDECAGSARFTEACGYGSPTRYAVLDPSSIRNS